MKKEEKSEIIKSEKNLRSSSFIDMSIHRACLMLNNDLVCVDLEDLYDDNIIKVIKYLKTSDSSLKNYGFYFKENCSLENPRKSISDLWSWLKRLLNLKENDKKTFEILGKIYEYLKKNLDHPTKIFYGFEIVNSEMEIFKTFGWINNFKDSEDLAYFKLKVDPIIKKEFTRSLAILIMNFQFEDAIYLMEQKNLEEECKKYKKEILFIKENIILLKEYLFEENFNTTEITIIKKIILSFELEEPYLKFIQLFISGHYLIKKEEIFTFKGVNFFDKLLFVLRFLYKDAEKLINDYLNYGKKNGEIETLVLCSQDQNSIYEILQIYLDKTQDLITVGLASMILNEIFPNKKLKKFIECCNSLLNDLYLFNLKGSVNKQLNDLRNKIPNFIKNENNIKKIEIKQNNSFPRIYCFFCQKEPILLENSVVDLQQDTYTKICLKCYKNLYNCSVCLSVIEMKNKYVNGKKKKNCFEENSKLILWCVNCHHGGHCDHIKKWFGLNDICPIFDCDCECNSLN